TKTRPKLCNLLCGERLDDTLRLFEPKTESNSAMRAAIADRAACCVHALEMGKAGGDLLSVMEPIQTTNHSQAMIYGLRRGLRLLVQLMPNIVQQRGLSDLGQSLVLALKPASEVQQVIGVGAHRARRQLTKMLGIEKIVDPD